MLNNLKDKLRSEMDSYDNEELNDAITDFVDMLMYIKEGAHETASTIITEYLIHDLPTLAFKLRKGDYK